MGHREKQGGATPDPARLRCDWCKARAPMGEKDRAGRRPTVRATCRHCGSSTTTSRQTTSFLTSIPPSWSPRRRWRRAPSDPENPLGSPGASGGRLPRSGCSWLRSSLALDCERKSARRRSLAGRVSRDYDGDYLPAVVESWRRELPRNRTTFCPRCAAITTGPRSTMRPCFRWVNVNPTSRDSLAVNVNTVLSHRGEGCQYRLVEKNDWLFRLGVRSRSGLG
jgi:hypothetical protein